MRYCRNCRKFTAGRPAYCQFCASSYGVKLCPRGHKNPRAANACSECGSKELSTPHGPQSGLSLLGTVVGLLILAMISAYGVYFAYRLLLDPNNLLHLMLLGFGLGVVLLVFTYAFDDDKHR